MKPLLYSFLFVVTISHAETNLPIVYDATGRVVDCSDAVTTLEVNACIGEDLRKADVQLNAMYRKVMHYVERHDEDWNTLVNKRLPSIQLRDAQRLWIKQRGADCGLMYSLYHQGTIRNTKSLSCSLLKTKNRTQFLQSILPTR